MVSWIFSQVKVEAFTFFLSTAWRMSRIDWLGKVMHMRRELKTRNALMAEWGKLTEEAIFIRAWDSATASDTTLA